jgi:hypothetical protein
MEHEVKPDNAVSTPAVAGAEGIGMAAEREATIEANEHE